MGVECVSVLITNPNVSEHSRGAPSTSVNPIWNGRGSTVMGSGSSGPRSMSLVKAVSQGASCRRPSGEG